MKPRLKAEVFNFGLGFRHFPRDLTDVNALKRCVQSLLLHKNIVFRLNFASIFCTILFSFLASFTFDILDPGQNNLLNNTCGALCGGAHNFSDLLR